MPVVIRFILKTKPDNSGIIKAGFIEAVL